MITGLPKNEALREGQVVFLTCSSSDGSPKPQLTWFKVKGDGSDETEIISDISNSRVLNDDRTSGTKSPKPEMSPSSEKARATIKIIASREDNYRLYR